MKYTYTKLADLGFVETNTRVNVFGVVKGFESADATLRLSLWDPSLSDGSILCILAPGNANASLPDVRQMGDIIRLHRVAVQWNADTMRLYGRMGVFGLSAVVWDSQSGGNLTPRASSSATYTVEESDYEVVRFLRQHIKEAKLALPCSQAPHDAAPDLLTVSRLVCGKYASIFVKVIGLWDYSSECAVVRVTDGTKPISGTFKLSVDESSALCVFMDREMSQAAAECTADVLVYDEHKQSAMNLKVGEFVLIKNLRLSRHKGRQKDLPALTIHGSGQGYGRGLYRYDSTTPSAIALQRDLDQSFKNRPPSGCSSLNASAQTTAASSQASGSKPTKKTTLPVTPRDEENIRTIQSTGQDKPKVNEHVAEPQTDSCVFEPPMLVKRKKLDPNARKDASTSPASIIGRSPANAPALVQSRRISSINDYEELTAGVYELCFSVESHDQDLDSSPQALFQWRCPSCDLRLSFDEHYMAPLSRWIKCKRCSGEKGTDVPFDLISRFVITASFVDAQKQADERLAMKVLVEGAAAESILGKPAKYLWRDLRTEPTAAAAGIKLRLRELASQVQCAVVDMKVGQRLLGPYERRYTVIDWKKS